MEEYRREAVRPTGVRVSASWSPEMGQIAISEYDEDEEGWERFLGTTYVGTIEEAEAFFN